jgi:hypothetical protein
LIVAITVRALLKSIVGVFGMFLGGTGSSVALDHPREILTLSNLIARIRLSTALRSRFVDNPRAVLLEYGIDPTPYNLPGRMSSAQMDRLLAKFAQAPGPVEPPTPPTQPPGPPAPVYGPPPGPSTSPPPGPLPRPPAPVYGPPPGLTK